MSDKLNDMIATSLDNIRSIADANTIVGNPIHTDNGTVILPVSKVSMGFASGGADYFPKDKKTAAEPSGDGKAKTVSHPAAVNGNHLPCFGGGGGTGITVTPVCFLVVKPDGEVQLLNIADPSVASSPAVSIVDTVSDFLTHSPELIARFKDLLGKKKASEQTDLDDETLREQVQKS